MNIRKCIGCYSNDSLTTHSYPHWAKTTQDQFIESKNTIKCPFKCPFKQPIKLNSATMDKCCVTEISFTKGKGSENEAHSSTPF